MAEAARPKSSLPHLLLLLLLSLSAQPLTARRGRRGGGGDGGGGGSWRPLKRGALECGSEFHDPQSKLLQSALVVHATWRHSDEHRSGGADAAFNATVFVRSTLKPWNGVLAGSRITVGSFNRSLKRRRGQQKQQCTPGVLDRPGKPGYILFLSPTGDKDFFRHKFLPVKFTRPNKLKLEKILCKKMRACPAPPEVTQSLKVDGGGGGGGGQVRLVCAARGLPAPRPRWLREGVEVGSAKGEMAKFRVKSDIVTTRLVLKIPKFAVGNFTCQFRNLAGSVSSSLLLHAADTIPDAMLCLRNNFTCYNGGTCRIDERTKKSFCICPIMYTGILCEKHDLTAIGLGPAVVASHGGLKSDGPVSSTALAIVFVVVLVTMAVVLLVICLLLYTVRRRLDRRRRRSRNISRSDNRETQFPSSAVATAEAQTMTEADVVEKATLAAAAEAADARPLDAISNHRRPEQRNQPHRAHQQPQLHHQQPQLHHQQPYAELPIRPIFDYSAGAETAGPLVGRPDLMKELSLLSRMEQQQLVAAGDESDEAERLLPFPGHGRVPVPQRQRPSSSSR